MNLQDIEIIREFYDENSQALYVYALALVRDRGTAEDIVHNVFERLLGRFFLPRELRPYVYRAIRNACYDLLRHDNKFPGKESLYEDAPVVQPGADLAVREEAQNLLAILSDDERECVVLKLFDALTFREIAQVRGVPMNTVASWYRRALEKMKAATSKEE